MRKSNVFNPPPGRWKENGSGGGGDDMQSRIAKLESDMEHVKKSIDDIKLDVRELKKDFKDEICSLRNVDIRDIKKDMVTDFRILFGAIIAVALGLAGLLAKGFGWF